MSSEPSDAALSSTPPQAFQDNAGDNAGLVQAIAAGNRLAEQAFVDRYMPPVRAILLARSRNPDLAADLRQDVMIEALCALRAGRLNDPEKLTHFVIAIARNLLNNHFRSQRRTEPIETPEDLPDLSCATQAVEDEERSQRALHAISSLDRVDRDILLLTLVEGLKPGAIAERLGLSNDVVRQRKQRATRRVIDLVRSPSQNPSGGHFIVGRVI
jgi:RNA polymerase sigma-70 factor (ECF subfamily)